MDHPCDNHIHAAEVPAECREESAGVATASTSSLPADIQAGPSFQQETPMAFQVPSHSQHEDYLPQLTEEQKEELMRLHTQLTSQENPGVNQVTSFEFEELQDKSAAYNEIFKEPQDNVYTRAIWREPEDKDDVYNNPLWGESQAVELPDDSKSISEEEYDDQEVWSPPGKRKQGRPIAKSKVNSIEQQQGRSKRGRPVKSNVKRKL